MRDAHRRWIAGSALALGLVAATSPTWRVLLLGRHPTLDELLQMRCLGGRIDTAQLARDRTSRALPPERRGGV